MGFGFKHNNNAGVGMIRNWVRDEVCAYDNL